MNCLVVGCGSMGARRARILAGLGHVVHCSDADEERAALLAAEIRPTQPAGIVDQTVHAVFVCTWPASHVALALQAVQSGAHVFIVKPLALSEDGLDELECEAAAHGVKVMVGCNWRFHPAMKGLDARQKAFGVTFGIRPRLRDDQGGGLLLDVGSHALDLAGFALGATKRCLGIPMPGRAWALATEHERGSALACIFYVEDDEEEELRAMSQGHADAIELTSDPIMFEHETAHFLRAIATGAPHMNPLSEARDTLRWLLKAGA